MKHLLDGIRILVIDDDEDNLDLLESFLSEFGGTVAVARSAMDARARLADAMPDVIVSDLSLPDEDGCALIASIRAGGASTPVPAIALTGHAEDATLLRAAKAGFARHIAKPADPMEILATIASVVGRESDLPVPPGRARSMMLERLVEVVADGDLGGMLRLLNGSAPHRFTSMHRFDGEMVATIARFDRAEPDRSDVPATSSVAASYCEFVRNLHAPFVLVDAANDARVVTVPGRGEIRAYCGVPLFKRDGAAFGSLCHWDVEPRPAEGRVVALLERAARLLRSELPALARSR
jgi:CheY-like chemotaxis protein